MSAPNDGERPNYKIEWSPEKIPDDVKRYLTALGVVFGIYPHIENNLFAMLGTLSRLPIQVSLALFGDWRTDAIMQGVRRVLNARKKLTESNEKLEEFLNEQIEYVFVQLGIINGTRNKIVHYGTPDPRIAEPVVTNAARARDGNMWSFTASASDIENMARDPMIMGAINPCIIAIAMNPPNDHAQNTLREVRAQNPWRYKSPLQGDPAKSRPSKTQAPTDQR